MTPFQQLVDAALRLNEHERVLALALLQALATGTNDLPTRMDPPRAANTPA